MGKSNKNHKKSLRKRRPAPVPAPRRVGWKSSQSGQCVTWWDADHEPYSEDWRTIVVGFLVFFVCCMALLLIAIVSNMLFVGVAAVFTRKGNMFGDELEILWGVLVCSALLSAYLARAVSTMSIIFRFEIDLEAQRIVLHQTGFPNLMRVAFIPFAAISHVRLRRFASYGGVELEVHYGNDEGRYLNVGLGHNIDEHELQAHVDLMRPVLGERVLALFENDS